MRKAYSEDYVPEYGDFLGSAYIAVYGSLLPTQHNTGRMKNFYRVGPCRTEKKYLMCDSGAGFPYLIRDSGHPKASQAVAYLFRVGPATREADLLNLDAMEGHPDFYTRRLISVLMGATSVKAWCYLVDNGKEIQHEKLEVVVGADWDKYFRCEFEL